MGEGNGMMMTWCTRHDGVLDDFIHNHHLWCLASFTGFKEVLRKVREVRV
jgi:hypothetical protein